MLKRLVAVTMLAAGLALVGGSGAYADPVGIYPSCTFEKGLTTCTTFYQYTGTYQQRCMYTTPEGGTSFGYETVVHENTFSVTHIYKGRNTRKEPISSSHTEEVFRVIYVSPCVDD